MAKIVSPDFMRTRSVVPLVLSMSLPMVFSMLFSSLYNIVDSYFVAGISEDAMTALSLVFPIQNLLHAVSVGFGVGINAVIAYHTGAGENDKADRAASVGVLLSFVHSVILGILSITLIGPFLGMFTESETIIDYGIRYSAIAFAFVPVDMVGLAFEKIFQSQGRMKVSMMAMMVGCIANIILDPLMIFGIGPFPELGIEGAAIATGLGQVLSLIVYLVIIFVRPLSVRISPKCIKADWKIIGKIYSVGIPAILNMALPSLLVSALNTILAPFSGIYILILGIYYKLQTFLYLPASGFVQGMRPIVGYNYGAGEKGRVKDIFLTVIVMCALIMLIGTILCLAIPGALIGLFSSNPETIAIGESAMRIISLGFIVSSVSVAASGLMEGLGKGLSSLWISLLRYVALIIPVAYILCDFFSMGPEGVWHAFWISELLTAVFSAVLCRRFFKGWL